MTKKDLAELYAKKNNTSVTEATKVIDNVIEVISDGMMKESIILRGFGTFKKVERKERKAQNIKSRQTIIIPSHYEVKFVLCDALKERMAIETREEL